MARREAPHGRDRLCGRDGGTLGARQARGSSASSREQRDIEPSPDERLGVVRRYVELCREHFRDDEKGVRARSGSSFSIRTSFAATDGALYLPPRPPTTRVAWGEDPANELEDWLCRSDLAGVTALARWLVDGEQRRAPLLPIRTQCAR